MVSFMPTFSMSNAVPLLSFGDSGMPEQLTLGASATTQHAGPLATSVPQTAERSLVPGVPPLPQKIVKRILNLEFVEMHELLPDAWRAEEASKESCCRVSRPRRGPITDITLWAECFTAYAAVLSAAYPAKSTHLWAYMRSIVKASRNFEGASWASYDAAYRRQAANKRTLDWSVLDPALYSEAFTGRARSIPRCRYCLEDSHLSRACPFAPVEDVGLRRGLSSGGGPVVATNMEVCRLFNRGQCRFRQCKYVHVCARCRRGHPILECGLEGRRRGRSRSISPRRRTAGGSSTADA